MTNKYMRAKRTGKTVWLHMIIITVSYIIQAVRRINDDTRLLVEITHPQTSADVPDTGH